MHRYANLVWNPKAEHVVADRSMSATKADLSTVGAELVDFRAYMSASGT